MVIGDFYVFGAAIFPPEDDAPLVVDSERVVSVELSPEKMKSIARGASEGHPRPKRHRRDEVLQGLAHEYLMENDGFVPQKRFSPSQDRRSSESY